MISGPTTREGERERERERVRVRESKRERKYSQLVGKKKFII